MLVPNAIPDPDHWYDEQIVLTIAGELIKKKTPDEKDNVMISVISTGRQRQHTATRPDTWRNVKVTNLELPQRKGGLLGYSERPAL